MSHHICLYLAGAFSALCYLSGFIIGRAPSRRAERAARTSARLIRRCGQ